MQDQINNFIISTDETLEKHIQIVQHFPHTRNFKHHFRKCYKIFRRSIKTITFNHPIKYHKNIKIQKYRN